MGWLLMFLFAPWSLAALSIWLSEGPVFVEYSWAEPAAIVAALLSLAFNLWAFVEIGLLRGQAGPNRFGPAPE